MIYVSLLATHPSQQGRGYATALLKTIIAIADAQNRALFLHTSSEANVEFYAAFGLVEVGHELLGEDNPTWHQDPVRVSLMVREPNALGKRLEELGRC